MGESCTHTHMVQVCQLDLSGWLIASHDLRADETLPNLAYPMQNQKESLFELDLSQNQIFHLSPLLPAACLLRLSQPKTESFSKGAKKPLHLSDGPSIVIVTVHHAPEALLRPTSTGTTDGLPGDSPLSHTFGKAATPTRGLPASSCDGASGLYGQQLSSCHTTSA